MSNLKGKTKFETGIFDDTEDEYDIDAILKQELAEQNLDYRYIDYKHAKLNGGRNRNGWIVYRRKSEDPRLQGIQALMDPDGLVRNGSQVLAVKTKANAERQRARIRAQNRTMTAYNQAVAEELDQKARALGGNSRIVTGYDKNR